MNTASVTLTVKADVYGKEEIPKTTDDVKKMGDTTEQAGEKLKVFHLRSISSFQALSALRTGVSGVTMGFRQLGLGNEAVNEALNKFHGIMMLVVGVCQLAAAAKTLLANATWAHVAAMIAEQGWLAPVVLGVIAGALAGLIALKATHMMASGGEGVVTRPTMFMAGEAGPEYYKFTPLGGSSSSSTATQQWNIYVSTSSEKEAAEEINWEIRKALLSSGGTK